VGGRYSEFNMGLLHLAIIGVDIEKVFTGAQAMAQRCSTDSLFKNPAYLYAALHYLAYKKKGKLIAILMPFTELLTSTADWYCQLLAESLGKKYARKIKTLSGGSEAWEMNLRRVVNGGRTPIAARGTTDLHSIQQNNIEGENNKTVTMIRVERFEDDLLVPASKGILSQKPFSELLKLAQEATEWALVRNNRPNATITLPQVTPESWGGLLYFFEMATAFEGELLNVNAFDQPGVEGYKNYMYYKLQKPGIPQAVAKEIKEHPVKKFARFIL
jgi:glucose-6-phosphate isomerase